MLIAIFLAGFFCRWGLRQARSLVRYDDLWSISIMTGRSPLSLSALHVPVANPVLTARDVTDFPASSVADPFMVREQGRWYMFFEAVDSRSKRGKICYAESADGLRWQYRHTALEEDFHLSYPYVFKSNGEYYMIPESHEDYSVRLYKAVDFPRRWVLEKKILYGDFVDSSVFRHNGRWWLFTTDLVERPRVNMLRLYSSDKLTGPWIEHPRSPLTSLDARNSRGAGRVLVIASQAIRFAQDDSGGAYGNKVSAFRITQLSPETYRETEISRPILNARGTWNRLGMHQVDPHPLADGTWLACVDGHSLYPACKCGKSK